MDKINELLSQFSNENGTPKRGTSDLSPLEQWLLSRLAKHEEFFDGVNIVIQPPSFHYNSTTSINEAERKITFNEKSIDYLIFLKGQNPFLKPESGGAVCKRLNYQQNNNHGLTL